MLDLFSDASAKAASSLSHNVSVGSHNRRKWTMGEVTDIVAALATLKTADIANVLGVSPKALRSLLRRNGISLRALRDHARKTSAKEGSGVMVRRPVCGPSALYGAAALVELPDDRCRWPIGDPSEADFRFCGGKAVRGKSYCRAHQAMAFERRDRHEL